MVGLGGGNKEMPWLVWVGKHTPHGSKSEHRHLLAVGQKRNDQEQESETPASRFELK